MLIYDQPIERARPEAGPAAAASAAGFNVLDLAQLLWQQKVAIASAALISACVAVAVGKSLTPKYTASAQLYVDPRELQLVDRELTPRAQDTSGLAMVVESQARVITSNNVLLQVIRDTHLEKDPEFGGGDSKGILGSLLGLFGVEMRPTAEQQKQVQMGALETLIRHVNVKKTDRTFIVDIDVWSYEPAKAAMLANAISKAYLALTLDAQAKYDQIETSRKTSTDAGAIPEALQSQTIANLRAQYAEARKRQAELQSELGPRHPALRQMEQQVQDLRRAINEEVERFAQSAKNDLVRARDYEASLGKALEAQKRQSVQMSQASVRLRELEREVEASRDVYQSFLKRSRETEEQESLNTSNARIIGDATVPQRRTFPPAMSLLAMIGFVFGGLAASGWFIALNQLMPGTNPVRPRDNAPAEASKAPPAAAAASQPPTTEHRPQAAVSLIEKPVIARLQEADVMRTLGSILATDSTADVTRLGWPTLRAGFPLMTV